MSQIAFDEGQRRYIGAFAARVERRMKSAGARIGPGDVFQELCIAWCKARDTWRSDLQVPFKAYLMRGMQIHINRWVDNEIGFSHLTPMSLDNATVGESDAGLHEVITEKDHVTACDAVESKDAREFVLARLSPRARLFVELLDSPPVFMVDAVKAGKIKAAAAKARGLSVITPNSVTASMVFEFMQADPIERRVIYKELAKMAKMSETSLPR